MDACPPAKGQVSLMKLSQPMQRGTLLRRYKRFLADVLLDTGEEITAHCANPGAMLGLDMPGLPVYLSKSDNPKRKLAYSLELVRLPTGLVGINTNLPNKLVAEALAEKRIESLAHYENVNAEVKYGEKSRVDFLLTSPGEPDCYLEIKNVHLSRRESLAEFPDCKTARGARHLNELANMVECGHRAMNLFIVQRTDCTEFALASDIDPAYAAAAASAQSRGVEIACYTCSVTEFDISIADALPIIAP